MKIYIDLRSDTVTKPTPAMRRAMSEAEVGDDVFGEDPTVNALQEKVAALLGKEKALLVPSGTMANQLSIKAHTQPGDEVILEASSHPYNFEGGASAVLSGVQFFCLPGVRGILNASQVEEALRPLVHHRERLAEDHANAKRLALGLSELPGVSVNQDHVETNIVIFEVKPNGMTAPQAAESMKKKGC